MRLFFARKCECPHKLLATETHEPGQRICLHLTGILLLLLIAATAEAQEPQEKVRVATRLVKPFVFEEKGKLVGFSIDLWQHIGSQIGVQSEFLVKPTVADLLTAVQSHEAELGIAAVSITAEREKKLDFSFPMFDAGLQILVLSHPNDSGILSNIVSGVFSYSFLPLIGIILLLILIPAHIVWVFERSYKAGLIATPSYLPGIFKACWWAAATLATQAEEMPKSALGRIVAVIWMFTSVVFVAYFTATVTSSLTVQQLRGDIKGHEDLPGKRVASISGSTSAEYLRQQNVQVMELKQIEDAYQALLQGQADAVVYDAPVLLYYAAREGKGKVQVAGSIFRKESYGIVFPDNSPYRKRVNEALLTLRENGTYQELYKKWFGGG
ncbi:MAG: transporter substrate-binding domain-containing protein [Candidatus Binatia bacterium]